jgi:hypothetical protein
VCWLPVRQLPKYRQLPTRRHTARRAWLRISDSDICHSSERLDRIAIPFDEEEPRVLALKALFRYFSFLFHGLLALFLLAISGLTLATGAANLHLGMLPWTGSTLVYVLFLGSLAGLVSLVMAFRRTWTWLFFVWALAVFVLLVKGYVFTGYHFATGEAKTAGYLILGSFIALIGAWTAMGSGPRRKARY